MNDLLKRAKEIRSKFDHEPDPLRTALWCRKAMDLLPELISEIRSLECEIEYMEDQV
jgi:hypothetical protein